MPHEETDNLVKKLYDSFTRTQSSQGLPPTVLHRCLSRNPHRSDMQYSIFSKLIRHHIFLTAQCESYDSISDNESEGVVSLPGFRMKRREGIVTKTVGEFEVNQIMATESGWDRIKHMYRIKSGHFEDEGLKILNTMLYRTVMIGFCLSAMMEGLKQDKAEKSVSKTEAMRKGLASRILLPKEVLKTALKDSVKLSFLSLSLLHLSQTISAYKNKTSVWELTLSSAIGFGAMGIAQGPYKFGVLTAGGAVIGHSKVPYCDSLQYLAGLSADIRIQIKAEMDFISEKCKVFVHATDLFQSQSTVAVRAWSKLESLQYSFRSCGVSMREASKHFPEDLPSKDKLALQDRYCQAVSSVSEKVDKYMTPDGQPAVEFLQQIQFFDPTRLVTFDFNKDRLQSALPGLSAVPESGFHWYRETVGPQAVKVSGGLPVDLTIFWNSKADELPQLSKCARKYIYALVNSADAERSFSLYNLVFSDRRRSLSEDNLKGLVFMFYNNFIDSLLTMAGWLVCQILQSSGLTQEARSLKRIQQRVEETRLQLETDE